MITIAGLKSGHIDADTAQALIAAALLSLLVCPTAARVLLAVPATTKRPRRRPPAAGPT